MNTQETPKMLDEVEKKKKYQSQINYDKRKKQEDDNYRKKKNEMVRKRNAERYATDEAYRLKVREAARARNKKIMDIYKNNKQVFAQLSISVI